MAALSSYVGSFSLPFIFDDHAAILKNPTIGTLGDAWSPPTDGRAVTNRPILNLSFALNYAWGKEDVWSYRVTNLAIHALAGLTLFGLMRRTLTRPILSARFGSATLPLAFTVALLWTVHPLQTESVSFAAQRTETLVSLFYLLTLYCFARGAESPRSGRPWHTLSVLACVLGMGSKEVMASAPVMVFLYDRTFFSGTFAAAWARRRWLYVGLIATWPLLGFLISTGYSGRAFAAGYDPHTTPWTYLLKQCEAIVHYLWLSIWPHPLIMDYGTDVVQRLRNVLPQALLLLALFAGSVLCLWRRPVIGFLGIWFFAILSPSSSFIPLPAQTMAEHRMYLPLVSVIAGGVTGLFLLLGRRSIAWSLVAALACIALTARRNLDYRTETTIWRDTVAKRPGNDRAHYNLGWSLPNHDPAALTALEIALRLRPNYLEAHFNLANRLLHLGRPAEALSHFDESLRLKPGRPDIVHNRAQALAALGRIEEAIEQFELVFRINPGEALGHVSLANILAAQKRIPEALEHYATALRLEPEGLEANFNLGTVLLHQGRAADALRYFETAVRVDPKNTSALLNLGVACLQLNRLPDAIRHFERVLQLTPTDNRARNSLGLAFVAAGRRPEAAAQFLECLRLNPNDAFAREQLQQLQAPAPAPPPR